MNPIQDPQASNSTPGQSLNASPAFITSSEVNPEALKSDVHNALGNVERSVVNSNLKDEIVSGFQKDLQSFKDDLSKLVDDFQAKLDDSDSVKSDTAVEIVQTPAVSTPEVATPAPKDVSSTPSLKDDSIASDADLS